MTIHNWLFKITLLNIWVAECTFLDYKKIKENISKLKNEIDQVNLRLNVSSLQPNVKAGIDQEIENTERIIQNRSWGENENESDYKEKLRKLHDCKKAFNERIFQLTAEKVELECQLGIQEANLQRL
ncbi:hypothetical protein EDEG_02214 [Edhazardia aedis USNM 41457]|uniref:Uncharacterized protein n=1 Tax=Edhazardia aedis (strain USNM 41457) TaxID=1003232 RepID=J9D7E9_EDHAE|nr:hypothetical protein EDEG_02214 [Edhazardia aedis USNM 41457]|eukprot:EJW03449.1 hypothetical protein EDEG_02214 [Edhazardia aedis USNM 41457]